MFHRLLIANRGEVAVRIARAARELSISPIGVASEGDLGASWLAAMDEVVCLGPAAAKESYLDPERVVQAALQTRASAVHPGWGFLAENARFAALVEQHGMTFVGPKPAAMALMGLKTPAKRAMKAAGLAVIPGSDAPLESLDAALSCARDIGFPVIVKADAGGGGRGMRKCTNEAELIAAWTAAAAEARAAFGNGAIYLERYLERGRHIEVQVLVDAYGHAIHLFERECSVQRKHQKLVEESPSPVLTQRERDELGAKAARAAASIGYQSAGTMEFFRAPSGEIFFMEMNTRLQVEHPVTEMVTGVDLAQWMIRIAANEPLTLAQRDVQLSGHAIEVRVNAEDPSADFKPSPGTLTRFEVPRDGGPGRVRVDTHVQSGDRIPPYYDSLIAKVIAWGETRDAAIETLVRALAGARIEGVATTIPLSLAVLRSPEFRRGEYDTSAVPGWPPQR
ncbi:MAG: acetyl-CoA carboxylase biotin carboxylase subunit [Planctomycetes bacterium]|nr:acetyl-CoA carboxylase biotin carboxylase subunit [Planctomycetota bacterium]